MAGVEGEASLKAAMGTQPSTGLAGVIIMRVSARSLQMCYIYSTVHKKLHHDYI